MDYLIDVIGILPAFVAVPTVFTFFACIIMGIIYKMPIFEMFKSITAPLTLFIAVSSALAISIIYYSGVIDFTDTKDSVVAQGIERITDIDQTIDPKTDKTLLHLSLGPLDDQRNVIVEVNADTPDYQLFDTVTYTIYNTTHVQLIGPKQDGEPVIVIEDVITGEPHI